MPALKYNFEMDKGSTFSRSFKWLDAKGVGKSLVGWKARSQWKAGYGQPVAFTLSTENNRIKLQDSVITVKIEPEDTTSLNIVTTDPRIIPKQVFLYDLWLFSPDKKAIRFMVGTFTVYGVITDAN